MLLNYLKIFAVSFILFGCDTSKQIEEAKKMSDKLLDDIANGSTIESFPEKYFPPEQR